jgi:hypothetical protein
LRAEIPDASASSATVKSGMTGEELSTILSCTIPSQRQGFFFCVQFGVQPFDFQALTFHFLHMGFKFFVMLPVEGGGKVFGGEQIDQVLRN